MRRTLLVVLLAAGAAAPAEARQWSRQPVDAEPHDSLLAVGARGDAALLSQDLEGKLLVRSRGAGRPRFGRAETVFADASAVDQALAVGPHGELLVAYVEPDSVEAYARLRDRRGRWRPPSRFGDDGLAPSEPTAAFGPDGSATLAFLDDGFVEVTTARRGRAFGRVQPVSAYEQAARVPPRPPLALAVDAHGRRTVAWTGAGTALRAARAGSVFAVVAADPASPDDPTYRTAFAGDGSIAVAWRQGAGPVEVGIAPPGRALRPVFTLPGETGRFAIAAAGRRNAAAAWAAPEGGTAATVFAARAHHGRWGPPQRVAVVPDARRLDDLTVAVSPAGKTIVGWDAGYTATLATAAGPGSRWQTIRLPGVVVELGAADRTAFALTYNRRTASVLSRSW